MVVTYGLTLPTLPASQYFLYCLGVLMSYVCADAKRGAIASNAHMAAVIIFIRWLSGILYLVGPSSSLW